MKNVDIISSFFQVVVIKLVMRTILVMLKKVRQTIMKILFMYNKINEMFPFIERNAYHGTMSPCKVFNFSTFSCHNKTTNTNKCL